MKLQILSPATKACDHHLRGAMFRHRAQLFADRLGWENLQVANGEERDEADGDPDVEYLVTLDGDELVGSCRMVPMRGMALLAGPLRHYLDAPVDFAANPWELSRFAPATDPADRRHGRSFALLTAGALEWCLQRAVGEIYGIGEPKLMGIVASLGARVSIEGPQIAYAPGQFAFAFKFPVDDATLQQTMSMQGLSSVPHAEPLSSMESAA